MKQVFQLGVSLALCVGAGGAAAQKAALVQNADDILRVPYQEVRTTSCAAAGSCFLQFSRVAVDRRRVVEQVSCLVTVNPGGSLGFVVLGYTDFGRFDRAALPYSTTQASAQSYSVNQAVKLIYRTGETPQLITVSFNAAVNDLQCTLTGREISLP